MRRIQILDSTLRDGAQAEGVSFSVNDKLNICRALDEFGVDYIEAGNPVSNPKDAEFFRAAGELNLKNAKLCAFGSTRRPGVAPEEDASLCALAASGAPAVTLVGKAWDRQVTEVLGISLEENLELVSSSIAYLASLGLEVIFDAEHFFDGWMANREYTLSVIRSAAFSGASTVTLCDTNGGNLPFEIYMVTKEVVTLLDGVNVAIHCHNDTGCAVANSMAGVYGGANQVQGTFIGIGERCGNANLSTIIPNLVIKSAYSCSCNVAQLFDAARHIAEISNVNLPNNRPYIGSSAFAHKGGMHIDAVLKNPATFEHIDPELVGNKRRLLTSEVSGRSAITPRLQSIAPERTRDSPEIARILAALKESERLGYSYEAAEASLDIMVMKMLGTYRPHFRLVFYKTMGEFPAPPGELSAFASVKIEVDGRTETTAETGAGPVNALDLALRKALRVFYPDIADMKMTDYKVRVLEQNSSTVARVRVLMESCDGQDTWTTVGVSNDVLEASLTALVDAIEFKLSKTDSETATL